mmetsp:Transcript_68602/g.127954  ORF Transcript_68602/g.127954 Transcript_68602/m.127954 type:complete len:218 (-) Transcript_68602:5-658(-)
MAMMQVNPWPWRPCHASVPIANAKTTPPRLGWLHLPSGPPCTLFIAATAAIGSLGRWSHPRHRRRPEAGPFCNSALNARTPQPKLRCKAIRFLDEDEDQPDHFFMKDDRKQSRVVPAWGPTNSSTRASMDVDAVYFHPQSSRKEDENGWINPKLYKMREPTKEQKMRSRLLRKRKWRKMSKKWKDEARMRRYPRDESGNIVVGRHWKRADPDYAPGV